MKLLSNKMDSLETPSKIYKATVNDKLKVQFVKTGLLSDVTQTSGKRTWFISHKNVFDMISQWKYTKVRAAGSGENKHIVLWLF